MIKVDGVEIPTPSEYNPYPELREKSSENSLGDVKRKIISCRWKLEMKWDLLTKEQYAQLINPKGNAFKLDKKTDTVKNWTSVSLNFIQLKADKYTGGAY